MIVEIQQSAIKDLKSIDNKVALNILSKIKQLENYPHLSNIKKLTNHYPPLRYRIGDYRVLFDTEDNKLIVVSIKHRKDAYN